MGIFRYLLLSFLQENKIILFGSKTHVLSLFRDFCVCFLLSKRGKINEIVKFQRVARFDAVSLFTDKNCALDVFLYLS